MYEWVTANRQKSFVFRYVVGKSRHRAHARSQREESGESQFQGSLWRATLSRKAWMPIWGSLDRVYEALAAPGGGKVKQVMRV